ncbi:helix-turn-helix transcriptional regulator [Enterobacteriaceae bacterium 89]|jgi:DNA-binding CsgD family transcriptional regulator|nr:helix-turn-helix transcriptional regulator [Enterobacteriaceae bacterium 89]
MEIADCVFSDNYFFSLGISQLLTSELITEHYSIIDIETSNHHAIKTWQASGKSLVAFIGNDLDYYTLRDLGEIIFINKNSELKEILSCFFFKNSQYVYQVKYQLSLRELQVLSCIQKGLNAEETGKQLGMNAKTFYTHRRSLVAKLRTGNRIALYQSIARATANRQQLCDSLPW